MMARISMALAAVMMCAGIASAAEPVKAPTFTKDVAPIFQAKCEACHRTDSMAPMSLTNYQEARPWARAIKTRVTARQMPPWHIDKNIGIQEFKNDRSLTDAEIDTISRWVDAGAPMGDPKEMPPPVKWPDASVWNLASRFGPPDLVVPSPAFTMPAHSQDAWDKRASPSGVTEPRWVRGIEIRPATNKGRKIVHHALARLSQDDPTDPAAADGDDDSINTGPGLFMEWAVGKQGEIMREGTGKLLLPGSQFVWDIHYSAAGEEITNNVELGIWFYPKGQEPKHRQVLHLMGASGGAIDIPPNTIKGTQGFFVMKQNGRVESFQPHMHLRGKAMTMEAILPTGQSQMLSHVNNFNFNWHTSYYYADDAAPLLPKGTILKISAWHDNTSANKSNPDPNQWVGSGDRTVDEMAHAWVNVTYLDDEDYKAEVAKRKAVTATKTNQQQ
jgi:hypothetical protein